MRVFRPVLHFVPALLALLACEGDRERTEARALLSAYSAVSYRAPATVREPTIAALEKLVLTAPVVAGARDECAKAHRALLASEREHESAANALDQALAAAPNGAPLPVERTESIREVIAGAERALADAKRRFESCEAQIRDLELHYGKR